MPAFFVGYKLMTLEQQIEQLITPAIEDMGFSLVRVKFTGSGRQTLQIMAERKNTLGMGLEDCAEISRVVSAILDVEDVIKAEYDLEVSSPGIDRPLVKLQDFIKFKGYEIKLNTSQPIEARKKFVGRIKDVEGEDIIFTANDQPEKVYRIPFESVHSAKLVINEEILRKSDDS